MEVSIQGVYQARRVVSRYLKPTPLIHYPLLDELLGCESYVKHEECNPTGAFKIRGGINLIAGLPADERRRGVITATRGNHGQSIALASRIFGVRCVVGVPEGNNPEKNQAMEAFGAELLISGKDFDEAREKVEEVQAEKAMRYVHSGNEPPLIHGVGTYVLEIVEELPDLDCLIVPIGGGSGAAAALTVLRAIRPAVEVVGVQAENAPSIYLSWKKGSIVETESADTIADGLATRVPFELTYSILRDQIDDILTVSEEEIRLAVFQVFRTTHHVAEPAAAATVAAGLKLKSRLRGKKVVLALTGCNIDSILLREILVENSS
jgi:threonine dehydratase